MRFHLNRIAQERVFPGKPWFLFFIFLAFLIGTVFAQEEKNGVRPLAGKPELGASTGREEAQSGISSGQGGRAKPQVFTGITKPLPGESRFRPGEVEKPNRPIRGTAVYPVTPSAWYPYTPRGSVPPLNSEEVPEGADIQSGDHIPVPTLAPHLKKNGHGNGNGGANESEADQAEPTLSVPGPKTERKFDAESETQDAEGIEPKDDLAIESAMDQFEKDNPAEEPLPLFYDSAGNEITKFYDGTGSEITTAELQQRIATQIIYGDPSCPEPSRYHPVAGDPAIPIGDAGLMSPIGPPKTLRYGLVTDSGILNEGLVNTPYAPGQAAPKVWSNGREVTMTERAQWAEGYAPIIRRRCVMASHTHVATSLAHHADGLEHCPVCCQPYLCGCGEETCRFCNPESRIGPAPVCKCCGDARPCIHGRICEGQLGHGPYREFGNTSGGIACPICKEAVERVPCGCCEKCQKGETCELYKPCGECPSCLVYEKCDLYRACRNCVLMNRLNSCNRCDNRINGEPCGTCDWCRQNSEFNHEPCGHQEVGLRHKTIYNPYNEPKLFSAPTRIITNRFNNNASRFPIYYNPAPHYKETSNPSLYGGFQRPFTHRYTCDRCRNYPCDCNAQGYAGQVAYAYACKFCNRNPCACAAEICNSNMPLNPTAVTAQLNKLKEEAKPVLPDDEEEAEEGMNTFQPLSDDDPGMSAWGTPANGAKDNATNVLPTPKEPLPFQDDPPPAQQQQPRGGTVTDSLFE